MTNTRACTDLVVKVRAALDDIQVTSHRVDTLVAEIFEGSNQQNMGLAQISKAMSQMDQVTQRNSAIAEESAAASAELSHQAVVLRGNVAHLLRLVGQGQSPSNANDAPPTTVPDSAPAEKLESV